VDQPIVLSQKLYLLGIHPEKGGIISASYSSMDYILLGSLFLELFQSKNIRFEKKRIEVIDSSSENSLHQFLLDKLSTSSKPLKISRWINKFYFSMKYIRTEVQKQLVDKNIIRMQHKSFLFFKWKKPLLIKKQEVYGLVNEIERNIFGNPTSEEELMLLSLLKPAGLLKRIFPDKNKLKRAKKRLNKLTVENQISIAVSDAISAAQAVAASVAATTVTTSSAT